MTETSLLERCQEALGRILASGAHEAEVYGQATRMFSTSVEKNDLQISRAQHEASFGLRAFVGRRVGFTSTNDLVNLERACTDAVALAKASPTDAHSVLPETRAATPVNGIYDPAAADFTVEEGISQAIRLLEVARSVDHRIIIGDGGFFTELSERAIVNSSGLCVAERGSLFSYYALATARDGDLVGNMDFQFGASRSVEGIDVAPITRRACENALGSLGAERGESFVGPVLLSPNAVASIFVPILLFQINAKNMLRGMSRWKDLISLPVSVPALSLVDDGHLPGGVATSSFDREGTPRGSIALIDRGKLSGALHNAYTAHASGGASTGHASGSAQTIPGIGPTNLSILPGEGSKEDLIGEMNKGILLTRFSGNTDPISGDFSGVAKGAYLVIDGKIERAVTGTLIAGNVFEVLRKLTGISEEREALFHLTLPYLRLADVSVTSGGVGPSTG